MDDDCVVRDFPGIACGVAPGRCGHGQSVVVLDRQSQCLLVVQYVIRDLLRRQLAPCSKQSFGLFSLPPYDKAR